MHPLDKAVKWVTFMRANHKVFAVRTDELVQSAPAPQRLATNQSKRKRAAPWNSSIFVKAVQLYLDQCEDLPWYILMDNDTPHCSAATAAFFKASSVSPLHLPPCSPDLSPPDYGLYGPANRQQRGWLFSNPKANAEAFADNYTAILRSKDCTKTMGDWHRRLKACHESGGQPVE